MLTKNTYFSKNIWKESEIYQAFKVSQFEFRNLKAKMLIKGRIADSS